MQNISRRTAWYATRTHAHPHARTHTHTRMCTHVYTRPCTVRSHTWLHVVIITSQHCQARGHVCEYCNSKDYLFPFQVAETTQCSACKSYFHSECFRKMQAAKQTCPKCKRIAALRDRKAKEAEAEADADADQEATQDAS
jgi:hypothetical protein